MGLTPMERQAQKRLSDAKKREEQRAIKERSEPLSSYAQEVKDRMTKQGQSYEQATSGASERTEVTSTEDIGGVSVPTYGEKAPDPAILAAQQAAAIAKQQEAAIRDQQAAQQRLVEAQRRGNIEALRGAETTALGATGRQREKTVEEAFGQRRGIKTQAKQAERSLAQYLASRGLGRSGAAVGGTIAQDVTLQEGLGQARSQEATRLGDIGQRETDIRTQTASGIAQAGQQAEAQRAQLAIQQLQQQAQQAQQAQQLSASRDFEQQQFERNQQAQIQQEKRQQEFERAQAEIDLAIEDAKRVDDRAREDELLQMKQQNAIALKQTVGGGTVSRGGGGLTYAQTRQQFNDQVKSYEQGLDSIIARAELTGEDANAAILRYMRDLQNQNVDPEVIAELGQRKGAGSISPPQMSLGGIRIR